MSLNSQSVPGRSGGARPVKHLVLADASGAPPAGCVPRLYFEAKIDFADVRSGLQGTCGVNQAFEMFVPEAADAIWTRDMAREVDPDRVRPVGAEEVGDPRLLPDFVNGEYLDRMETLYLSFLMRHFAVSVYRNFYLRLYSDPGERAPDFEARCVDLLGDAFRLDLDALHETFVRKLEQVRERYAPEQQMASHARDFDSEKLVSILHDRLHEGSERITELFLEAQLSLDSTPDAAPAPPPAPNQELVQRLHALEADARQEISRLRSRYQERVRTIDEYALHPNFRDIHLVRTAILWVAAEVVSA